MSPMEFSLIISRSSVAQPAWTAVPIVWRGELPHVDRWMLLAVAGIAAVAHTVVFTVPLPPLQAPPPMTDDSCPVKVFHLAARTLENESFNVNEIAAEQGRPRGQHHDCFRDESRGPLGDDLRCRPCAPRDGDQAGVQCTSEVDLIHRCQNTAL